MPSGFGPSIFGNYRYSIYCSYTPGTSEQFKSAEIKTPVIKFDDFKVYPNPFNENVTFEFVSAVDARAFLGIYNIQGQLVSVLMEENVKEDVVNRVEFTPVDVASGILIYRLILDDDVNTGRLIYRK
jgi:hypothetical protein